MHVVICGAGVIGAAVAYFLSERGVRVTVVEPTGVACAASGKAGGFLALDWCDGTPLMDLARTSFAMHAELPDRLGDDSGYRRLETLAVSAGSGAAADRRDGSPAMADGWVDGGRVRRVLGSEETTAQVHPERFTRALLDAARDRGAVLVRAAARGVERDARGAVRGVDLGDRVLEADAAVIAMGPWTERAAAWLPLPWVRGLKGYSLTLHPRQRVPAQALFVDPLELGGRPAEPEVFPRPDGEVYVCGLSEEAPVPASAAEVSVDAAAGDALRRFAGRLSGSLRDAACGPTQACYRPLTLDGLPLLGAVPGVPGAYVATGHGSWGILLAPASGLALAELIADGRSVVADLTPFDPGRLPPLRERGP